MKSGAATGSLPLPDPGIAQRRGISEMSEALLVPSARRVGVNLVIYPKSLRSNSVLEMASLCTPVHEEN